MTRIQPKQFLNNAKDKLYHDDVTAWASKLSLYLMLSIFPIIILLAEVMSRLTINDPTLLIRLTGVLPDVIIEILTSNIRSLSEYPSKSIIPIAVFISLWAASRGTVAIDDALKKAYGLPKSTKYLSKRIKAMLFTVILLLLIIVAMLFIVFGNNLINAIMGYITLPDYFNTVFDLMRYLGGFAIVFIFFLFLYNMAPGKLSLVRVLPGALFASAGLVIVSAVISIYVKYATTLTFLYGSLTSVIVLLVWLYAVSYIIILGGELNAMYNLDREAANQSSSSTTSS